MNVKDASFVVKYQYLFQEVGSKLLGRVFAYGAVIQSDRKLKVSLNFC